VALVLNQISLTDTYTCEYCAGTLPVADTSVFGAHPMRAALASSTQPIPGFQRLMFNMSLTAERRFVLLAVRQALILGGQSERIETIPANN
jgi:hypothetical protein